MRLFKKLFGTRNDRDLKKLDAQVQAINDRGDAMKAKSDAELKAMTGEFRQKLDNGAGLDDILEDSFATVREAAIRVLGMRHYDVQLVGGMVLHSGRIAEMRTGEGKTLTATLPAYLNALTGKGVHIVTVNDYLASRDAEWMGQIYNWLGLSVGCIVHGIKDFERQRAYRSDISFGQNNEFGFDYLRDNMKMSPDNMVQRPLNFAIVDEVDSILIDEARTPLIISGPAEQSANMYREVDKIIPRLKRDIDYTVDEKGHSSMLTDSGNERVQKLLSLDNLYDPKNIRWIHHVVQALKAHTLYKRDVSYLIKEGKVVIVDEHTGRQMPGRRWSDGLHQAIEAKEGVNIEEENQTLATVTFQNFFRMYEKLSGMTGTADTEASEFAEIYKLDCLVIPTNKPLIRDDMADLIYKNEKGKFRAVIDDIKDSAKRGQPVLVGTISVEKSEVLATMLRAEGVEFDVLNAKNHGREALTVAQAGRKGAITVSTSMAGRGTDIVLGGNAEVMAKDALENEISALSAADESDDDSKQDHPVRDDPEKREARYQVLLAEFEAQCKAERIEVLAAGGLRIVGTERHESRRIDNQLRGRAGRQGDQGASRFYLSLDDDLMRIFGADRIRGLMERLGMEDDVPIEHKWVSKAVENAQKKVEGHNFDIRKNVLEYDDVMNQQRKTIYSLRRQILEGRYAPELSDEDKAAGKEPVVPTESGDWTVEGLLEKQDDGDDGVREYIGKLVEKLMAAIDERIATEGPLPDEQPAWRILRQEVWRQTGTLLDLEKRFDDPRDELVEYIARNVALSQIQQRERLYDLSDELIGMLVATHCPAGSSEDEWDFDALDEALRDQFNSDIKVPRRNITEQELAQHIWNQVEATIDEREKQLTRPFLLYFSRHFLLEDIDSQWIDHLRSMDHLREGIYLRGYGQKDPKKEYKKEGFDLFAVMMNNINVNAARNIFHVMIEREDEQQVPELQAKERKMTARHPNASGGSAAAVAGGAGSGDEPVGSSAYGDAADGSKTTPKKQETVRRDKPKVGRNDPCPCGSGKKYKKCHGRAGADAQA